MYLKIIIIYFLLTLFGCKSHKHDFSGTWIPEIGMFPTLEIKDQSIIISSQSNIREFSYSIKNNQIILNDSVGNWFGFPDKSKETFIIKKISGDSLILSYADVPYDFLLIKNKLPNYQKFSNITLVYSNGWDRSFKIEIDSLGKMKMRDENISSNIKRFGNVLIKPEIYQDLMKTLNYLYSHDKIKRLGSCADCATYGLSLYRNDSVKSFFADNSSIHSVISKAILPLLSKEYEKNLKLTDTMKRIYFPKFFGRDTILIEKIKN